MKNIHFRVPLWLFENISFEFLSILNNFIKMHSYFVSFVCIFSLEGQVGADMLSGMLSYHKVVFLNEYSKICWKL